MSIFKDVGNFIIKKGAPLLGSVIGGPAGGAITGLVASLFDADPTDPADLIKKIEKDPKATEKLIELQMKHKERLEELEIEQGKIELEAEKTRLKDVQSARDREVAIVRRTGKKDINLYVLAWVVVAGFFILTGILMFVNIPEATSPILHLLFGGLVSGFATVLGYFFGSSKGSADKTGLMALQPPLKKTESSTT